MMFNPDITKLAQEVIFSRKTGKPFNPQVFFNEVPVERSVSQKHLGLHLDQKLDFGNHINEKISQKGTSVIKKLHNFLPKRRAFCNIKIICLTTSRLRQYHI